MKRKKVVVPQEAPSAKVERIARLAVSTLKVQGSSAALVIVAVPNGGQDSYYAAWHGRLVEIRGLAEIGVALVRKVTDLNP